MLKEAWNDYMVQNQFGSEMIKPRFLNQDGKLTVGIQGPLPIPGFNDVKIPYKLQQVLSEVDQNIKINFTVGTDYKTILESNEPMLKHLSKGFSFGVTTSLISNWKQEIIDMIHNETAKQVIPAILELAFDADIDI